MADVGGSPVNSNADAANVVRTSMATGRGGGGPRVTGIGTGEGMVLPPRSEPWLSGMLWASPSTQRSRCCFLSPEFLTFILGFASMLSGIVFISSLMHSGIFEPFPFFVFLATGLYCVFLIRKQRALAMAEQAMLLEILEARAAEPSRRVLTKEERRAILHYFTLQPASPASSPTPPLPVDTKNESEGRKQLQNGGKEEDHRSVNEMGVNGGVSNMEGVATSPAVGTGGGDASGGERVAGLHEDTSKGACTCFGDGGQHLSMEAEEKGQDKEEEEDPRKGVKGNLQKWSTERQCIVCFGDYAYGDDLCRLPCGHMYHAKCIDEWLDGENHAWCPLCKLSLLDGDRESSPQEGRNEPEGDDIEDTDQQDPVGDEAV